MTKAERDAWNVEYVVVCKGWKATAISSLPYWTDAEGFLTAVVPDYLSDEADAWRRVKALLSEHGQWFWTLRDDGEGSRIVDFAVGMTHTHYIAITEEEATMRACIALKVRVM